MLTPEDTQKSPRSTGPAGAGRILSCLPCQHRKVKCDRNHPCTPCTKSHITCVPATQARPRRRRFPEKELLERLRQYEDLLRKNNIPFDPLHGDDSVTTTTPTASESTKESPPPSSRLEDSRRIWDAAGSDAHFFLRHCIQERTVKNAWNAIARNSTALFFGQDSTAMHRSALHPSPIQVLRLWQTYIEGVEPLLKVTHPPSLQPRIIEAAAGDVKSIEPALEALMFGIYCISTSSLTKAECQSMLGLDKEEAMKNFLAGSQQSLLNCRFLQTTDRDCLTAYFLYLSAIRPIVDPGSLSPMIALGIRIAQSMRIHRESALAKCSVFEAEMRRRLWWSFVFFDTRIGQLAYNADSNILTPGTWDCAVPLNVNDIDLRPDMTEPPASQRAQGTDAIFAVVRAEMGEWVRNAVPHLNFINPALKALARKLPGDGSMDMFEKRLEDEYLRHLDLGNPVHFMTALTTRSQLAKIHVVRQYTDPNLPQTEAQRDADLRHSFQTLDCDTNMFVSPLTKRFRWFLEFHFPAPAYLFIVQELRKRPHCSLADQAWEAMYQNCFARFGDLAVDDHPLLDMFSKVIMKAWETIQQEAGEEAASMETPKIIVVLQRKFAAKEQRNNDARAAADEDMQQVVPDMIGGYLTPAMSIFSGGSGGGGFGDAYGADYTWMETPSYMLGDMIANGFMTNVDMNAMDPTASTRWG